MIECSMEHTQAESTGEVEEENIRESSLISKAGSRPPSGKLTSQQH
eukprot:COSAG06_NODE_44701_length_361_cov_0.832061_1_plen_45_part_10